ncbi:MAG: hypothetical protein ACFB9N_07295 [Geitlerinemataceae cyanobacterium]
MNNQSSNAEEANSDDRFFDWLRGTPASDFEPGELSELTEIDPDLPPLSATRSDDADPATSAFDLPPVGDIPAVQTRFNALIERRLRVEIERNLPLFPWEERVMDYDLEMASDETIQLAWLRRLRQIELPVGLPDRALVSIFSRCQELARQPLKEGLQIVRAIEHLFPESERLLHELTGTFLREATVRDDSSFKQRALDLARTGGDLPESFDRASVPQQALLAMLAARDIFADLTFELTPQAPRAERRWSLDRGDLVISAEVTSTGNTDALEVRCAVPTACTVRLSDETHATSSCCDSGETLHLKLDNASSGLYTLEVDDGQPHTMPLQFAIRLA